MEQFIIMKLLLMVSLEGVHPEFMNFENPENGTWVIYVNNTVTYSTVPFTLTASTFPSDISVAGNLSDVQLGYLYLCGGFEEGLRVVLKGTENASLPVVDVGNASSMSLNSFLTGLVIPNSKQWLSLNKNDVSINPVFAQTETAQILLDADLKLKSADQSEWVQVIEDSYNYWNLLIQNTSYYNKITSKTNWYYQILLREGIYFLRMLF